MNVDINSLAVMMGSGLYWESMMKRLQKEWKLSFSSHSHGMIFHRACQIHTVSTVRTLETSTSLFPFPRHSLEPLCSLSCLHYVKGIRSYYIKELDITKLSVRFSACLPWLCRGNVLDSFQRPLTVQTIIRTSNVPLAAMLLSLCFPSSVCVCVCLRGLAFQSSCLLHSHRIR